MRRLNTLTFKQLRTLDAVVQTRSLSAAAAQLSLTTPAIHSQLKTLEDHFGSAMLYRDGPNRFSATPEGDALLDAHRKCNAALKTALRRIDALKRGLTGVVVLGVVSTGKYFAPSLVASIKQAYPDIEIILKDGNRTETIAALTEGSIDLAIMGRPPREPLVEAFAIGAHPHILIAPPQHRLAALDTVQPDDILSEVIILREDGSGTRILATRFLDRIGQGQPYTSIQMGSNESIKQSVIAGLGIALISRHTVTQELATGRLVELRAPELPIMRTWYILHQADIPKTGAMDTVLNFIKSAKGSFLPE